MPPRKRQRLEIGDNDSEADEELSSSPSSRQSDSDDGSLDDVQDLRPQKSRQTAKRKLRATTSTNFGETLQSLLDTNTPSTLPLSLNKSANKNKNDEKLEKKARKSLANEKKELEEKGRVADVIGGWGAEGERALRKTAQRGVVKLFNVIQQAQSLESQHSNVAEGAGKASLPSQSTAKDAARRKGNDNALGRGKQVSVNKTEFFDMIKLGSAVSKD